MSEFDDSLHPAGTLDKQILDQIRLLRALANFYIENPTDDEAADIVNQRVQILKAVKKLESDYQLLLENLRLTPPESLAKQPEPDEAVRDKKELISAFIRMTVPEESQAVWDPDKFTGSLLMFFVNGEIDSCSLIEKKSDPVSEEDFASVEDMAFPEEHVRVVDESGDVFAISESPDSHHFDICFRLEEPGRVVVRVYNELEKLVQEFDKLYDRPGEYVIEWDGRDERGNALPSGTYYCQIQIGENLSELKAMHLAG